MSIAARLDRLPLGRFHWNLLGLVGIAWLFDSFNIAMVSFVLPVLIEKWGLSSPQAGFVGSAQVLGMLVGAAGVGVLSDRLGRKVTLELTVLVFGLGTGMGALIDNYAVFTILRFVAGIGLGGTLPVLFTLLSEFSPSRRRGMLAGLVEAFWSIGLVLAALVAYLMIPTMGWQAAFMVGALPVLYVAVLRVALPESPRFLTEHGRHAEASEVVRRLEAGYSRALPPFRDDGPGPIQPTGSARFVELWSKPLRRRTLCIWVVNSSLTFGYYGVFTWLPALLVAAGHPMAQAFQLMIILGLAQFPGKALAAILTDHIGRKWLIAGTCLLYAVAVFFLGMAVDANAILFWGSAVSFVNAVAWGPIVTYNVEAYPTRARSTGAGAAAAFSRIGGMLGPVMVGFLLVALGGERSILGGLTALSIASITVDVVLTSRAVIFSVFAAVLIIGAITMSTLGEETRGKTLEQIAR